MPRKSFEQERAEYVKQHGHAPPWDWKRPSRVAREQKTQEKASRAASRANSKAAREAAEAEKYHYKTYPPVGFSFRDTMNENDRRHVYTVRAYNRKEKEVGAGQALGYDNMRKARKKISSDRPIWVKFGVRKGSSVRKQVQDHRKAQGR